MKYPFQSTGRVVYNADRGLSDGQVWWCTIDLDKDDDLARYYRWWVDRAWWEADSRTRKRGYHKPIHPPHISIIRGETPRQNAEDWGQYRAGELVTFRYSHIVRQTSNAFNSEEPDRFWFVDTQWDGYARMRRHYGLPWQRDNKPFQGHITVAKTYE